VGLVEEEGILKNEASDSVVGLRIVGHTSVVFDASMHCLAVRRAVGDSKSLPGDGHRENRKGREESATCNHVVRSMQFEKQRLAWGQGTKLSSSARLPEVHFSHSILASE